MKVGISASIRGKLRVRTKVESRIMSHWGYLTEASCSRRVSAPSRGNAAAGTVDREKQDTRPLDRCQSRATQRWWVSVKWPSTRASFRLTPPPPPLSIWRDWNRVRILFTAPHNSGGGLDPRRLHSYPHELSGGM